MKMRSVTTQVFGFFGKGMDINRDLIQPAGQEALMLRLVLIGLFCITSLF